MRIINKVNFITFFQIIIYKLLLDYAYILIIVNRYDYQHYQSNPTSGSILVSWLFLLTLIPFIIHNAKGSKLSNLILYLFSLFSVVPTTTMIGYNAQYNNYYIILIFFYWFLFFLSSKMIPTITLELKSKSKFQYNFILFFIVFALIFVSYTYTGFRFHFGLMDVYDLRLEAREYNAPLIFNYLLAAADYILIFILIYNLTLKKYIISFLVFILNLLNFGISGSKHIVFLLILSLIVFLLIKSKDVKKYILPFVIVILLISFFEFFYFETNFLTLFFSYRVLFIPSKLHYIYFEYFTSHEFDYFRQSFLKFILDSPYKENIGFLIGEYDTGDIEGRANNGLFSDAYFNLGIFGVFLFPILITLLLKFFDGAVKYLNTSLYFSISLSIFLALLSLPLSVAFLSSGFLIFFILLYSIPRDINFINKHN
jgi:oligosaccharide repeat unit polymerase